MLELSVAAVMFVALLAYILTGLHRSPGPR